MNYSLVLHTEEKNTTLCPINESTKDAVFTADKITITLKVSEKRGVKVFDVSAEGIGSCYFSLHGEGEGELYSFNDKCEEEHVFRQSAHDPTKYVFAIDGSPVPMVAAVTADTIDIFISDNPSDYNNYTTQHIIPERHEFYLASGDPGGSPNFKKDRENQYTPPNTPYYHDLSGDVRTFKFIWVKSEAKTLKTLRRDAFLAIENVWGEGRKSIYRAMCFGANYMHIRKNETGTSDKWVVAGIQYANTQYNRDAFWQTWILSPEIEEQSYRAHTARGVVQAENPLFFVIWSYRVFSKGGKINKELCDIAFNKIIECLNKVGDGRYCPDSDENHAYRNWFDICCYEDDDADAYSQGLCVCALRAAKEMGYDVGEWYEKAKAFYPILYNGEFVQMSLKKPYHALDYSLGDLLHYVLFNEKFLSDEIVNNTYYHIMNSAASTPYGVKIVSAPDGSYLPMEAFGAYGKVHPEMARMDLGRYANGGSYHIYEMIFHIAAYVHGAKGALDNMIHRLMIDLDFDGATHEYMHTLKGNGVKANQGWNACIYAIWDILCKRGVGDERYFIEAEKKLQTIE
ncbi:MAG: hypothetical protein IJR55_06950 [Clostridia bacterium]|nr:hypothetical protein [Clostridia bacterium]